MKYVLHITLFVSLLLGSCSRQPRHESEGTIVYAIDYPEHKDNFFLYSILPKEMKVHFRNGKVESVIEKANLKNVLLIDCNQKQMSAYFSYGDEAFHVSLLPSDVEQMIGDQKKYAIEYLQEKDTMAGFNVQKAIATAVDDPADKVTLWYTDEIDLKRPNWYNPFHEIKGFLLAYAIDRYGIRMEFRAKSFSDASVEEPTLRKEGVSIGYGEYNRRLGDLFRSFE